MRGWDKNLPGRILGPLPTRKWVKCWQRLGQQLLVRLWRHVAAKSPAPRRRWPWTWVGDDSLFKKDGQPWGLVGRWWSGQEHRVRLGLDGLLLVVVIGDGKLVVPMDFVVRRPDPVGPGRPCDDQLTWLQVMLDRTWAALQRRCPRLPPPLVVADRWCGDSGLMTHLATSQRGTLVVEGQTSQVFQRREGRRVTGQELLMCEDWAWHDSAQLPGIRSARLTVTSPTDGLATVVVVDQPGRDRDDLLCQATSLVAPRLIRAWRRRSWIEHPFRTLKPLLATEACQMRGEEAHYGPVVLRLVAGLVRLYTARIVSKGHVTMEEILCSLKHHWRFLDADLLELQGLSWRFRSKTPYMLADITQRKSQL